VCEALLPTELLQEVFSNTVALDFWTMGDPHSNVTDTPGASGATEEVFYSDSESGTNEVIEPPSRTSVAEQ
jgi:hypothetical protein